MTTWLEFARRLKVGAVKLISASRSRPTTNRMLQRVLAVELLLVWIGTVGFGWMRLTAYENASGKVAISH